MPGCDHCASIFVGVVHAVAVMADVLVVLASVTADFVAAGYVIIVVITIFVLTMNVPTAFPSCSFAE